MANIERFHEEVAARLNRQYLGANPVYDDRTFRRRFRVSRAIYKKVHDAVVGHDAYFVQKQD